MLYYYRMLLKLEASRYTLEYLSFKYMAREYIEEMFSHYESFRNAASGQVEFLRPRAYVESKFRRIDL